MVGGLGFGLFFIGGWMVPARFSSEASVQFSKKSSKWTEMPIVLAEQPQGRRRFWRSSQVFIEPPGEVSAKNGSLRFVANKNGDIQVYGNIKELRSKKLHSIDGGFVVAINEQIYKAGDFFFKVSL